MAEHIVVPEEASGPVAAEALWAGYIAVSVVDPVVAREAAAAVQAAPEAYIAPAAEPEDLPRIRNKTLHHCSILFRNTYKTLPSIISFLIATF